MTPSQCPTTYSLTLFDITLNELTPRLKDKLPPTDSNSLPDQRHLEYGEYDLANAENSEETETGLQTAKEGIATSFLQNGARPKYFRWIQLHHGKSVLLIRYCEEKKKGKAF